MLGSDALAARIRQRGLPEVVVTMALSGGGAVHPALASHVESVWAPAWAVVDAHPELVPLWSSGTVVVLSAPDGTLERWSSEYGEGPLSVYPDLAAAVRAVLTDMWELEQSEDDRRAVAELLLVGADVEAALTPLER